MDRAGVAARGEVVGQGEGAAGLRAADAYWDRAPRNQMAAWTSGSEITLPVTGAMGAVMAGLPPGPAAHPSYLRPLVLSPGIGPSVTVGRDRGCGKRR